MRQLPGFKPLQRVLLPHRRMPTVIWRRGTRRCAPQLPRHSANSMA
jgi:hypothetical protein